jgi:ATP-dependent Clp protease protease subunit
MASLILAAGEKGHRCAFEHSRILLHSVFGGTSGQYSDIEIYYHQISKIKKDFYNLYSKYTNKDISVIEKDLNKDFYLDCKEAISYGVIDFIKNM